MSICKKYDCEKCPSKNECLGCEKTNGCPFGSQCICAEIIQEKGFKNFIKTQEKIINIVNNLSIKKLHIDSLNILPGSFVNLDYPLPNGKVAKFLDDKKTYFANQIEIDSEKCFGIVSDGNFILVARYGCNGKEPELIEFKKI